MKAPPSNRKRPHIIPREQLSELFSILQNGGYKIYGPKVLDGAIVLDAISRVEELPVGYREVQKCAEYRLSDSKDGRLFSFTLGPQSWKKFLFPAQQTLFQTTRSGKGWKIIETEYPPVKSCFLGVRPCEITAIAELDKVFSAGQYADPGYAIKRQNILIIAVICSIPGDNCFCTSMGTGPKAEAGFDLSLTEIFEDNEHYFIVEVGSDKGEMILSKIDCQLADETAIKKAQAVYKAATDAITKKMDVSEIRTLLQLNIESPRWKEIASRCLTCGNCTFVCPTCFCSTIQDATDLQGKEAARQRKWDSCFSLEYSYIHGGSVRYSPQARYRHWLMHKFANWLDQFGSSGCVGCGRCITWCPGKIDITEEIRFFRQVEATQSATKSA